MTTTRPLGPPPSTSSSIPAPRPPPVQDLFGTAAQAFRLFFQELQEAFFERETLLLQIGLALLCREHVLVTGPPGTAKSAVANSVLGRIVDHHTGLPSLFSKQLSETTVQADLIGPVNFKVLTETGRTEYLTDEGMLGAIHAFLDEVFDGRDMLLRSILNVLHERELKHGRKVTTGRLECAIMTSNRYLSEAVSRSPELLLAFADRLSFICFVPKSFARSQSRAAMLERATRGQRPELDAQLTIQHLDSLQSAVEHVRVEGETLEGVELLADKLEHALHKEVTKHPDYVPTKSFSQRSLVKALWALKAWVVHDAIFHRPGRPMEATPEDLAGLRHFFLLGGPPPAETEALIKAAADPRERAQLEIIRLEHRAFDEALKQTLAELPGSLDREGMALKAGGDKELASEQSRAFKSQAVLVVAESLMEKLVPGPRHPQSRSALVATADTLVDATLRRARRGMAGQGEGRGGVDVLEAMRQVFELCRRVPELATWLPEMIESTSACAAQELEMAALSAEGTAFDDALNLDGLVAMAKQVGEELDGARTFRAALAAEDAQAAARLGEAEQQARARVTEALRRRIPALFHRGEVRSRLMLEGFQADARRVALLEALLQSISGKVHGLREELLHPLAALHLETVVKELAFTRLEELASTLQQTARALAREQVAVDAVFQGFAPTLRARLTQWVAQRAQEKEAPALLPQRALTGEAYVDYRAAFASEPIAPELAAIGILEGFLGRDPEGLQLVTQLKATVAAAELERTGSRVRFLGAWLGAMMEQIGDPARLTHAQDADRIFVTLVKSRFPLLTVKEGELLRLGNTLKSLAQVSQEPSGKVQAIHGQLVQVNRTFGTFSKTILDARAGS